VLLLNIAPLAYFGWMWRVLAERTDAVIIAILPAFAIFGFYRIWLALTEIRVNWFYYGSAALPDALKTDSTSKVTLEPCFEVMPTYAWWVNLLFGALYVVAAIAPVLVG
jgi:hypothetical protein